MNDKDSDGFTVYDAYTRQGTYVGMRNTNISQVPEEVQNIIDKSQRTTHTISSKESSTLEKAFDLNPLDRVSISNRLASLSSFVAPAGIMKRVKNLSKQKSQRLT